MIFEVLCGLCDSRAAWGVRTKKKGAERLLGPLWGKVPATCYSPTGEPRSTLADEALHFRVRDGNGCFVLSMATGKAIERFWDATCPEGGFAICAKCVTASLWAISIGWLSALLRLHRRPIKVVVFHPPSLPCGRGDLVFGEAWRLDAFSAYPFRT